jgi:hypothetical protein
MDGKTNMAYPICVPFMRILKRSHNNVCKVEVGFNWLRKNPMLDLSKYCNDPLDA